MMAYEEGGVTKDFLTDHLGSITAEIDQNQNRTFETRYSAYGRNNWSTGTGCGFGWVGSFGYRETGLFHMSHYVRARHYSYLTGSWSTVDPLWPDEASYGYVEGWATKWSDPKGLACWKECPGPFGISYSHAFLTLSGCTEPSPKPGGKPRPITSCGFWPGSQKGNDPASGTSGVGSSACLTGSSAGSSGAGGSSAGSSAGSSIGGLLAGIAWPLIIIGGSSSVVGSSASGSGKNGGNNTTGSFQCPDSHEDDKDCKSKTCIDDPAFNAALCKCVRDAINRTPPKYCLPGYVCGSWVEQMWECAHKATGRK